MQKALHGGDIAGARRAQPEREWLDFSANINPLGMPESVKQAYHAALADCVHYPDIRNAALREALAEYEQVLPGQIVCGNGASELIYRLVQELRPKTALYPVPTFAEYGRALAAVGTRVSTLPLCEESGFALDNAILPLIDRAEMLFLCNPNNPTGRLIAPELLEEIAARCAKTGTWLVVDECFLDFVPDTQARSLKRLLPQMERLLVLRAFTKTFAMPGLRLGYLIAPSNSTARALSGSAVPWSVSVPAQYCGIAAAGERAFLERTNRLIAAQRGVLTQGLAACGCRVYRSDSNFILFRHQDAELAHKLREKGILIRDASGFDGLGAGYYRVAVRGPEENRALLRAMNAV